MRGSALIGLVLALAGQPTPPPTAAPPAVSGLETGVYQLAPAETRVAFKVGYFPFGTYSGEFPGASGELRLDPRGLAASRLEVKAPIAGVVTGDAAFTRELKSAGMFDAARYPFMSFRSTAITATGADSADVAGELTLHGVTRPVVFKARLGGAGVNPLDKARATGFEVRGVIRRREFGVTRYEPFVSDEVRIVISAVFQRAPS